MSVAYYLCNQYPERVKQSQIDKIHAEIGNRIVEIRKKQGISQEKLAGLSGIDRSHMGFIEQGRRKPTLSTLIKIAEALDISLDKLLKGL